MPMTEAYFSSGTDSVSLQERVTELLRLLGGSEYMGKVLDLQCMWFAFTDPVLYQALMETVQLPHVQSLRVIADYGNFSSRDSRLVRALSEASSPKVAVRFKTDFPYIWKYSAKDFEWNYKESSGLLHHKSLCVLVNGVPEWLHTGSYNWTRKSNRSYENSLLMKRDEKNAEVLDAFYREFEALWQVDGLSLSVSEAIEHRSMVAKLWQKDPGLPALSLIDFDLEYFQDLPRKEATGHFLVAFCGAHPRTHETLEGYDNLNRRRKFEMKKPNGSWAWVPCTPTNLSIDFLNRCEEGQEVLVAMYALSTRVAEFNGIVQAARRGVRFQIILNRQNGIPSQERFRKYAQEEKLSLEVKLSNKMMHSKYLVNEAAGLLLTGTANMTTDAKWRHVEHRLLIREETHLNAAFAADFRRMWERLEF